MRVRAGSPRTSPCDRRDGELRLAQAKKFLEQADVVAVERESPAAADGAASLAILAGIAASDAGCCTALGRRSRSQNHLDATGLLVEIEPGGKSAANALRRLLSIKDKANYEIASVSGSELDRAIRQARLLIEFAEEVMRR
jgi:hypothetical protein